MRVSENVSVVTAGTKDPMETIAFLMVRCDVDAPYEVESKYIYAF